MSEKKKIYVSGKISGLEPEVYKENFKKGEIVVHEMGAESLNPLDILPFKPEHEWIDYMRADIKVLVDCDGILMLPDWKDSKGAILELYIAKGLNMEIYYI